MNRLKDIYIDEVIPKLQKKFHYKNIHTVPKIVKVILNMVSKECVVNSKIALHIKDDLARISGQKPVNAKAKKSIAGFKLREGQIIGAFVTLRGRRMYEFLDRLITISLPRIGDFRGVSKKSFDKRGNYTLGLKEQTIFPEIDYDKVDAPRGIGISIVTTAKNDNESRELLTLMGMPFKK